MFPVITDIRIISFRSTYIKQDTERGEDIYGMVITADRYGKDCEESAQRTGLLQSALSNTLAHAYTLLHIITYELHSNSVIPPYSGYDCFFIDPEENSYKTVDKIAKS